MRRCNLSMRTSRDIILPQIHVESLEAQQRATRLYLLCLEAASSEGVRELELF